ncbi:outer membrane protein assembly factor BamB family protein [Natronobacterium texcoconense]|uniref:Outer membrane protein assembly factor BamB, contains PQQ-like beta-propeller repeat n=1 Tax=Natronobacterium texcoconense TaxID=1095778 RepID=A0A1H1HTS9_NATTX|nr:PQQ-binding-like beta-propeller repeat protein [Natronobacterium texcoconense]SDR28538.1 Outer membrane protein assembly factor BamB, contains PQQ-like beta-propeller repeat [Natronobacterium texcoconense]
MTRRIERRRYLQLLAAGGAVGVAGCSDELEEFSDLGGAGTEEFASTTDDEQADAIDSTEGVDLRDEASDAWPTFGGDLGNSGWIADSESSIETTVHDWTVDHRHEAIDPESFGAIAADGRVFAYREEFDLEDAPFSGGIVALEADTGEMEWVTDLRVFEEPGTVPSAFAPGTVVDDTLYVCANRPGDEPDAVLALEADTGETTWSTRIDGDVRGSPAVANGVVYVSGSNTVYALDATTGEGFWAVDAGGYTGSVATDGDLVVAVPGDRLVGIDAATGELEWETELPSVVNDRDSPVLVDGYVVYVHEYTGFVVDATNGDVLWQTEDEAVDGPKPAVTDDIVVFVDNDRSSHVSESDEALVRAFSLADGDVVWEASLPTTVLAPPVVVADRICLLGLDETLYVVDASDGDVLGETWYRGRTTAEPAVTPSGVFVGHDRGITAFSFGDRTPAEDVGRWPTTGYDRSNSRQNPDATPPRDDLERTWAVPANDPRPPIVADGVVVTSERGGVVGITGATGDVRWRQSVGPDRSFPATAPVIVDDLAIVGTSEGMVFGIRIETGETVWEANTAGEFNAPFVAAGDAVYGVDRDGDVYEFDPDSGDHQSIGSVGSQAASAPAVSNGTLFVSHGSISALTTDGRRSWTNTPSQFPATSPSILDELVVSAVNDGTVRAYDAHSGDREWSATVHDVDDGESMWATAVADGTVFTGGVGSGATESTIVSIDGESGEIEWRTEFESSINTAPVVADGLVWVVTRDGTLTGLEPETGDVSTSSELPANGSIVSELVAAEDRLFGVDNDTVYAFE